MAAVEGMMMVVGSILMMGGALQSESEPDNRLNSFGGAAAALLPSAGQVQHVLISESEQAVAQAGSSDSAGGGRK